MTSTAAAKAVREPDAHTASQPIVTPPTVAYGRQRPSSLAQSTAPPIHRAATVPQTFASKRVPDARPRLAYTVGFRNLTSTNNW